MIAGQVTLEDMKSLEIEVDTVVKPVLLIVPKEEYPDLKQGDIVRVIFEKVKYSNSEG